MSRELLLKRLVYRSGHRGCKETDLVFGKFCETKLATLDPAQLSAYERLLDEDDVNIWAWLTDKSEADPVYHELIGMLKTCGVQ